MITEFELAWIVGLLEGEGSFNYIKQTQMVYIAMRDEDVILKYGSIIEKIIGIKPHVTVKSSKKEDHSDLYIISVYGENARKIMHTVVRYMGTRRRAKIWQSLNKYYEREGNVKLSPGLMDKLLAKHREIRA